MVGWTSPVTQDARFRAHARNRWIVPSVGSVDWRSDHFCFPLAGRTMFPGGSSARSVLGGVGLRAGLKCWW